MMTDPVTQIRRLRWQRLVGTTAGVFLGLVLLVAAWGKAVHPEAFVEQIRIEGLDLLGLAGAIAFLALGLEVALGLAVALGMRRLWVLIPTALLVASFLFLTARRYWAYSHGLLDLTDSCGCFGNLLVRTPAEAFWQDLFLLAVPMALAFVGRPRPGGPFPIIRTALVALVSVVALVFAWKAPELPLDDIATRLRPGVEIAEMCAGSDNSDTYVCLDTLVTELGEGRHLVVLSNLDEPVFLDEVEQLNAFALAENGTRLWVLTAAEPEVIGSFGWTWAPAFEVRETPAALIRPLYRRLPRSFVVENGRVLGTFNGLPPEITNSDQSV